MFQRNDIIIVTKNQQEESVNVRQKPLFMIQIHSRTLLAIRFSTLVRKQSRREPLNAE